MSKQSSKKVKVTSEVIRQDYKKRWSSLDTKLTWISIILGTIIVLVTTILTFGGKSLEEVSIALATITSIIVLGTVASVSWITSGYIKYLSVMGALKSGDYNIETVKITPVEKWEAPKNAMTIKLFPVNFEFDNGYTQEVKLSLKEYKKCCRNSGEYYLVSMNRRNRFGKLKNKHYITILSKDKYYFGR